MALAAAAVRWLEQMLPEGSLRDNFLRGFAEEIASWSPDTALEWVRTQGTPVDKRLILSGLLSHLSGDDLRATCSSRRRWIRTIDPISS
jgi:hypothetical protein